MSDAALLEMLAGCEALSGVYARALIAIEQLTNASLEGRSLSTAILLAYRGQVERASTDLTQFRALVAKFKSQIRVH